jgi:hypothetical protein
VALQAVACIAGISRGAVYRAAGVCVRHFESCNTAREARIAGGNTPAEVKRRKDSDFLKYHNAAGAFADFHSNHHTFITTLERSGVRPQVAQTLARHSDIRLTLGIYTHAELVDQTAAITSLPAPPGPPVSTPSADVNQEENGSVEVDRPRDFSAAGAESEVPTVVPIWVPFNSPRRRSTWPRFALWTGV